MYQNFLIWYSHQSNISFPKEKKKKESIPIEAMMNENGGSIPTDSEEWTLHLLYFYLDVILALNWKPLLSTAKI